MATGCKIYLEDVATTGLRLGIGGGVSLESGLTHNNLLEFLECDWELDCDFAVFKEASPATEVADELVPDLIFEKFLYINSLLVLVFSIKVWYEAL